jgi:preprotein translocase subunit SecY
MIGRLVQIFKIKDLRNKVLFVLGLLIVFRIAATIPVPGVDLDKVRDFFQNNQLFGMLNLFSGGGMSNISIVMMGVGPYITASIVMQLLTMVIPKLHEWYRDAGEAGRAKFNQITRFLTVPFSLLQAYGLLALFRSQGLVGYLDVFELSKILIITTAGTVFLMWLGELITEKGIGNGISLIIFAGIIAGIPQAIQQIITSYDPSNIPMYIGFLAGAIAIIAGVVFITEAQRNIPISYARRIRGNKVYGGVSSVLPLKVNQAGVMPIIFALSILLFPGVIANFLTTTEVGWLKSGAQWVADLFANQIFYGIFYFILTAFFTYFYTAVTFEPKQVSENLQKSGGFIPGIRPGKTTEGYLGKIVNRITLAGALFLGVVAVLPVAMQQITHSQALVLGGTGLLIVVSVVLETMKQIESQVITREYDKL